jgi:ketosteroid isomerase-like protein
MACDVEHHDNRKGAVMQDTQNTSIVRDVYAAFVRGDIQSVLSAFDDQIDWKPVTGAAAHVPHAGQRRGKAAVAEFLRIVNSALQFDRFDPEQYVAQGDKVVALGRYSGVAAATGRSFDSEWAMVFTVRNGKIVAFQEFTDSAAVNAAWAVPAVA